MINIRKKYRKEVRKWKPWVVVTKCEETDIIERDGKREENGKKRLKYDNMPERSRRKKKGRNNKNTKKIKL